MGFFHRRIIFAILQFYSDHSYRPLLLKSSSVWWAIARALTSCDKEIGPEHAILAGLWELDCLFWVVFQFLYQLGRGTRPDDKPWRRVMLREMKRFILFVIDRRLLPFFLCCPRWSESCLVTPSSREGVRYRARCRVVLGLFKPRSSVLRDAWRSQFQNIVCLWENILRLLHMVR